MRVIVSVIPLVAILGCILPTSSSSPGKNVNSPDGTSSGNEGDDGDYLVDTALFGIGLGDSMQEVKERHPEVKVVGRGPVSVYSLSWQQLSSSGSYSVRALIYKDELTRMTYRLDDVTCSPEDVTYGPLKIKSKLINRFGNCSKLAVKESDLGRFLLGGKYLESSCSWEFGRVSITFELVESDPDPLTNEASRCWLEVDVNDHLRSRKAMEEVRHLADSNGI